MAFFNATVQVDSVTPKLRRLAAAGRDTTPVMRAMGNVFKSITEGNFSSHGAEFRTSEWAAKKDGSPATLKKSGLLSHSFHLTVTRTTASVSNPTPYAAAHQFGYQKRNLPARPFYPIIDDKLTPAAEKMIAAAGLRAIQRAAG